MPRRARGTLGHFRRCPKCEQDRPTVLFPLLNDPRTVMRGYATRYWCDDCLRAGGHVRRPKAVEPAAPVEEDAASPAARARVGEYALIVELVDLLLDTPALVDVLRMVTRKGRIGDALLVLLEHPHATPTVQKALAHPNSSEVVWRTLAAVDVAQAPPIETVDRDD